uniref:Uncharacterized protein n=1 Tax=Petromyzon marinus TaxID=7757 RepID=S4RZU2_PETMA
RCRWEVTFLWCPPAVPSPALDPLPALAIADSFVTSSSSCSCSEPIPQCRPPCRSASSPHCRSQQKPGCYCCCCCVCVC